MTPKGTASPPPVVRQVSTPAAAALAALTSAFEDLQTVMTCCERLVAPPGPPRQVSDEVTAEALWTTAVLSYSRCFSAAAGGAGLTEEDITGLGLEGDVLGWHRALLQMREHYAHPTTNPREAFSVGVSVDDHGRAAGVAVTSLRRPQVDEVSVRQTGAVAYALLRRVDARIAELQAAVLAAAGKLGKGSLELLPVLAVELPTDAPPGLASSATTIA